mmetsp:Transcript_85453/g.160965  ORF Transcript_85453/g.160965 Transcript_85453/m.160965 type:complete len:554 (+) Transcript_85453:87-1748(+)
MGIFLAVPAAGGAVVGVVSSISRQHKEASDRRKSLEERAFRAHKVYVDGRSVDPELYAGAYLHCLLARLVSIWIETIGRDVREVITDHTKPGNFQPECEVIIPFLRDNRGKAGIDIISVEGGAGGHAVVTHCPEINHVYLFFKGTTTTDIRDVMSDIASMGTHGIRIGPGRHELHGGSGFINQYGELHKKGLWKVVLRHCRMIQSHGTPDESQVLVIGGNSLGGALANIGAVEATTMVNDGDGMYVNWNIVLCTYGSPRVWRPSSARRIRSFFAEHRVSVQRWVNHGDPVTRLPDNVAGIGEGFEHVGNAFLIQIDEAGDERRRGSIHIVVEEENYPHADVGELIRDAVSCHLLRSGYIPRLHIAFEHWLNMHRISHGRAGSSAQRRNSKGTRSSHAPRGAMGAISDDIDEEESMSSLPSGMSAPPPLSSHAGHSRSSHGGHSRSKSGHSRSHSGHRGVGDVPDLVKVQTYEAFKRFDRNGDGMISAAELKMVLQHVDPGTWTDSKVQRLYQAVDANADGAIEYKELLNWVWGNSEKGTNIMQHIINSVDVPS